MYFIILYRLQTNPASLCVRELFNFFVYSPGPVRTELLDAALGKDGAKKARAEIAL